MCTVYCVSYHIIESLSSGGDAMSKEAEADDDPSKTLSQLFGGGDEDILPAVEDTVDGAVSAVVAVEKAVVGAVRAVQEEEEEAAVDGDDEQEEEEYEEYDYEAVSPPSSPGKFS